MTTNCFVCVRHGGHETPCPHHLHSVSPFFPLLLNNFLHVGSLLTSPPQSVIAVTLWRIVSSRKLKAHCHCHPPPPASFFFSNSISGHQYWLLTFHRNRSYSFLFPLKYKFQVDRDLHLFILYCFPELSTKDLLNELIKIVTV